MHDAERERAVGAGHRRNVLVALFRGQRTVRIDRDQLGAVALGLLRATPQVQVRRDRIGAPEDDQACVLELLDVGAVARAERGAQRLAARGRADRAVEEAGAEPVEEPAGHRLALHHAHRSRVAVRNDALRINRCDRLQPRGDLLERSVPADALEAPFTLAADAPQRMQQAIRVVCALEIATDLRAKRPRGSRMRRIAGNLDRDTATLLPLDGNQHRAGVGAVVRTRCAHDLQSGIGLGHGYPSGGLLAIRRPKNCSQAAICS